MWLEELAWLWMPILAGAGLWMIWRLVALTTEMRMLRKCIEQLEEERRERDRDQRQVA